MGGQSEQRLTLVQVWTCWGVCVCVCVCVQVRECEVVGLLNTCAEAPHLIHQASLAKSMTHPYMGEELGSYSPTVRPAQEVYFTIRGGTVNTFSPLT